MKTVRLIGLSLILALAAAGFLPGRAHALSTRSLSGTWRVYSATLYYDAGGGGSFPGSTRTLTIHGNRWTYGSSSGTFAVKPITAKDWTRWSVQSYGPRKKIVLKHWAGGRADGPIETAGGKVDFIWVIYHVAPPIIQAPGKVYLKFGRMAP